MVFGHPVEKPRLPLVGAIAHLAYLRIIFCWNYFLRLRNSRHLFGGCILLFRRKNPPKARVYDTGHAIICFLQLYSELGYCTAEMDAGKRYELPRHDSLEISADILSLCADFHFYVQRKKGDISSWAHGFQIGTIRFLRILSLTPIDSLVIPNPFLNNKRSRSCGFFFINPVDFRRGWDRLRSDLQSRYPATPWRSDPWCGRGRPFRHRPRWRSRDRHRGHSK